MTTLLTFLHVAAAILLLGPIVVSTSMFPRQAAEAQAGDAAAAGRASILYRISRTYGIASSLVPLLGVAILFGDWAAYNTNYFLHTSIVLAVIAWALLLSWSSRPSARWSVHSASWSPPRPTQPMSPRTLKSRRLRLPRSLVSLTFCGSSCWC